MKNCFIVLLMLLAPAVNASFRTVHVMVALCDNEHQGIVPVPEHLGNGNDPGNNLYWGAAFGLRTFFSQKAPEWEFIGIRPCSDPDVLERVLFKHRKQDVFLLADAYRGERIKHCIEQFLRACNGQNQERIVVDNKSHSFGGGAQLLAYIGHDGLMEFKANVQYVDREGQDAIVLACISKAFFKNDLQAAGATPVLLTTGLMAPEAYVLRAAVNSWLADEQATQLKEHAAQALPQVSAMRHEWSKEAFRHFVLMLVQICPNLKASSFKPRVPLSYDSCRR